MGEVYRARDARLGRDIALKILPRDLSTNAEALRRFELEARAASALNHPNIVTIYEIDREDSLAWIAMELIEGEDLGSLIDREPMQIKTALRIGLKIADGLAAAHERGIVHRDLKPDNVMITRDGFVKLLDFGLAKQIKMLSSDDTTMPHTSPGAVFGTVGYMAPEQAAGREMDYRSDQFSFGVILHEMLTRQRPFDRDTKAESLAAIIREMPEPPSAINEEVPEELDRLVMRCLQKEQRGRYGSTRDLAHDLREIRDRYTNGSTTLRSARIASGKSKPPRLRASRTTYAILALAFLGFLGGLVMWNRDRAAARANVRSVAVMPFRDLSSTNEGRMLADGISEMLAARLGGVREMHIAPPFDGAAVEEPDDVAAIAKRKNVHAVLRGSVQRSGEEVRVTYSLVTAEGETLASGSATRAMTELFALEDAVAEELIARLGREAPLKAPAASAPLGPADQQKFVEAIGLLHGVKDEQAVDRAIATLEVLLRNARESGAVNAQLARALLFKAKLARRPALIEQATVYATRGVALDADDADSQTTLGMLQNESGRHEDAARSFERALALRPDKTEALVGLGDAFSGLGRAADAEAMYRKAVALRPDVTGAATKFGMFLYAQGRHGEAAEQFRHVTELAPGFPHGWANLGASLQALNRFDEAKAALRKSIEIQPTAAGWSNLGTVQFLSGDFDAARASYERATQLAPGDPVMWVNLGDAHRAVRRDAHRAAKSPEAKAAYERAIAASRDALNVNPNDARARARIALCLAKSERGAEAQEEIRRALELDPTNAQILYNAAIIATLRGNSDSAMSWLERAIGAGYPAAEAANDPELEPLHALPSFLNAVKSGA